MDFDGVCVGIISKPVGVMGAVRIHPYTQSPSFFLKHSLFFLSDGFKLVLSNQRVDSKGKVLANIVGFKDRTDVERFRFKQLFVSRACLPKLEENEYYLDDLKNLIVLNRSQQVVGKVVAALDYGAGAFLDLKLNDRKAIVTIPFNKASILDVNLRQQQIIIDESFILL